MTKVARKSNIELLRIISIFLILVVHADFGVIGEPTAGDIHSSFLPCATRILFEMFAIICVDIFVFISGWFGIKFSIKGIAKLLFQIVFIQGLLYVVSVISGHGLPGIFGLFMFDRPFWFIKAYIGLMILSPVINTFVKYADRKAVEIVLFAYFVFQTLYAWLTNGAWFLFTGYCITSLSAIYLLARYIRVYWNDNHTELTDKSRLSIMVNKCGGNCTFLYAYLLIAIMNTVLYIACSYVPTIGSYFCPITVYYTNPFIILQSISLFMFFLGLNISTSKIINWIAASSFAVFILHSGEGMNYYKPAVWYIFSHYSGVLCLGCMFIFLVGVFVLSVLVDQPRKIIWDRLEKHIKDFRIE